MYAYTFTGTQLEVYPTILVDAEVPDPENAGGTIRVTKALEVEPGDTIELDDPVFLPRLEPANDAATQHHDELVAELERQAEDVAPVGQIDMTQASRPSSHSAPSSSSAAEDQHSAGSSSATDPSSSSSSSTDDAGDGGTDPQE